MNSLFYVIALNYTKGVGPVLARNLISYVGSAKSVFTSSIARLQKVPGVGLSLAKEITQKRAFLLAEKELLFIEKNNLKAITYNDKEYPKRLSYCIDGPLILYKKGIANLNAPKVLSIVGTRRATRYGRDFLARFFQELSDCEIQIVSGLAYGIDAEAHKKSIEHGFNTIGVVAHGLDKIYPEQHTKLASKMLKSGGAILSEYGSQEAMLPSNFPMRNRIIAGLADAVLIVETKTKGGAMITANIANSYNRDVFALPGKYKDTYSIGCNNLIQTHRAHLIQSAEDLIEQMSWGKKREKPRKKKQLELALHLNEHEQNVVNALQQAEDLAFDELLGKVALSSGELSNVLLELEFKNIIQPMPGNRFALR